jgi:opacity protein-like surface antigen
MAVRSLKTSLIVGLALVAAGSARAADYVPPPPPIIVPPPPPEEFAASWYLRGDIGMSNQSVGSLFNENYSRFTSVDSIDKGFDAAPFFGAGIGYIVNDWMRVDATAEYRGRANFHGLDIGHTPGHDWPDRYSASKSELTFLLNGYVDLGTWSNFTPFVGAGVGMSRNTISNFGDINVQTGVGADAHSDTASKWSFAWALYAGVGYKINRNVTVEFAYRYIDLGNATTGQMVGFDGTTDTPFEFRHLTSQDFKLGVRVNFDAFDCCGPRYYAPTYAPAPVYAPPPPVYSPPPVQYRG